MSNIKGDQSTIDRIEKAKPGDASVYVNLDAIRSLPDLFEAHTAVLEYNIDDDFTNVGTQKQPSYYPKPKLFYSIAEKCGISGTDYASVESIYEDVDISEMNMSDVPQITRKKVGYKVVKQSQKLEEDGGQRISSPRSSSQNAWDDCLQLWAKEEAATEGYNPELLSKDNYGNLQYSYTYNGQKKFKKCMYDTKWKRKVHFHAELDKAEGKADTKAVCKTIRELAGLKTGYTPGDLKEGKFYFVKITRSELDMKMESAARYAGLANGNQEAKQVTRALFSENSSPEPEINITPQADVTPEPEPEPEKEAEKKGFEITVNSVLDFIKKNVDNISDAEKAEKGRKIISWLEQKPDITTDRNSSIWQRAVNYYLELKK